MFGMIWFLPFESGEKQVSNTFKSVGIFFDVHNRLLPVINAVLIW